jgi:hypothetical protein
VFLYRRVRTLPHAQTKKPRRDLAIEAGLLNAQHTTFLGFAQISACLSVVSVKSVKNHCTHCDHHHHISIQLIITEHMRAMGIGTV